MSGDQLLALATPIAVLVAAIVQKLDTAKAERTRLAIAAKAERDAAELKEAQEKSQKTQEVIHTLVNDKFTKVTENLAAALQHTADTNPKDVIAAEKARAAQQAVADLKNDGPQNQPKASP